MVDAQEDNIIPTATVPMTQTQVADLKKLLEDNIAGLSELGERAAKGWSLNRQDAALWRCWLHLKGIDGRWLNISHNLTEARPEVTRDMVEKLTVAKDWVMVTFLVYQEALASGLSEKEDSRITMLRKLVDALNDTLLPQMKRLQALCEEEKGQKVAAEDAGKGEGSVQSIDSVEKPLSVQSVRSTPSIAAVSVADSWNSDGTDNRSMISRRHSIGGSNTGLVESSVKLSSRDTQQPETTSRLTGFFGSLGSKVQRTLHGIRGKKKGPGS